MNQSLPRRLRRSVLRKGLTLIEVLAILLLLVILVALFSPTCIFASRYPIRVRMASQLNDGRQLYYAMRSYASETEHEGAFPTYADSESKTVLFTTSNDVFTALLPRYIDNKLIFNNKNSAWCRAIGKSPLTRNAVLPGENDWCYMRGLTDKSDSRWPLLANAFDPGTKQYVKDQSKPGGVWKGENAVVIWAGGSAEVASTKQAGNQYFIGRPDKPSANAFEKDGDWLAGENVQLLYPVAP